MVKIKKICQFFTEKNQYRIIAIIQINNIYLLESNIGYFIREGSGAGVTLGPLQVISAMECCVIFPPIQSGKKHGDPVKKLYLNTKSFN